MDIQYLTGCGLLGGSAVVASLVIVDSMRKAKRHFERCRDDGIAPFDWSASAPQIAAPGDCMTAFGAVFTDDQVTVLGQLHEEIGERASRIAERTGMTEKRVSAARRELAAMGFAHYGPLYNTDSGVPHGSGYLLTPAGADAWAAIEANAREWAAAA